jgi:predicted nucleic acid-binding protein
LFIQRQIQEGRIEIFWSAVLDFEIKRSPFKARQETFDIFRRLSQTIVNIDDEIRHSSLAFQKRGLTWVDALHVACAVKARCDYFITVDKRIINKAITEINILNPIQFIQFHEKDFSS